MDLPSGERPLKTEIRNRKEKEPLQTDPQSGSPALFRQSPNSLRLEVDAGHFQPTQAVRHDPVERISLAIASHCGTQGRGNGDHAIVDAGKGWVDEGEFHPLARIEVE